MAAKSAAQESMLFGNSAGKARAKELQRLKSRALAALRGADAARGLTAAEIARHLGVTERSAKRLLNELISASRVEAVSQSTASYRLAPGRETAKPQKKTGPRRVTVVLGHELSGRQAAQVKRLLAARRWMTFSDLGGNASGARKLAQYLRELGITQLDDHGRVALTREAYQELNAG